MTSQLLYTPKEASEQLAIGRTRLFELIRTNRIATVTIGRSRRIPHDALQTFVETLREHD